LGELRLHTYLRNCLYTHVHSRVVKQRPFEFEIAEHRIDLDHLKGGLAVPNDTAVTIAIIDYRTSAGQSIFLAYQGTGMYNLVPG